MAYFEECLKRFDKLPADFRNKVGSLEVFEKIEEIEKEHGIDLKFLVILVAIGELGLKDIPEYLQNRFKLAEEDAYEIRDQIISEVFQLTEDLDGAIYTVLKTETEVINIFREGLAELLKNKIIESSIIEDYNEAIFYWLSKDGLLQESLSKSLLANQESILSARLLFEDKDVAGTISNWLKDFIKTNGSEIFNDLVLAQYLSTSANAKKLNSEDKNLVRKVLKLYRSLAFFPESMENLAISDWQIIPYDKSENNHQEMRDVLDDEETQTQTKIQTSVAPSKSLRPVKPVMSVKFKAPATPVNNETSTLFELQDALKSYTPDSLEHKAVAQEIERLNKKKKIK